MKKLFRIFAISFLALFFCVSGYYIVETLKARRHTDKHVRKVLKSNAIKLDLEDLSERQLDILLAVEDPSFFEHNGMDLSTPGGGITTITQGLVKQFYFDKFKPGIAKIEQTLIAVFALDPLVSKEDQLRLFINFCYMGEGIRGFEDAAQRYYGKPFGDLSEDEYISLVAMIIAPGTFSVQRYPERNHERVERIKKVVSGDYTPKGLFDLYYGRLDPDIQNALPPFSYFDRYYIEN
jgi:membrane peptidoglycan carboxypeptidase